MTNLFTSYLIQSEECSLPGIGSFTLTKHPSTHDVAGKEIFPPVTEWQFSENTEPLSKKFIHYVAIKSQVTENEASEMIHQWCKRLKEKLESGAPVVITSLGTLETRNEHIVFLPEDDLFSADPISAVRVARKEEDHAVLVGDRESNASEMNAILNGTATERSGKAMWKIAAAVLFVIGIGIILYHFSTTQTMNKSANGTKIQPELHRNTYIAK